MTTHYTSIQQIADELKDELIEIRRDLHRFPELSFQESRTSGIVAKALAALGIEVQAGIGGYGVVGELKGAKPGKTIAFRADMDALPIKEETGLPYSSARDNVMHACGHDAHTAILIGAAKILAPYRDQLHGTVRFIFQSAEEILAGAKAMIAEGVMDGVDEIYGLHNLPSLAAGKIAVKPGVLMAAIDRIEIQIDGKGGHGGYPDTCCDPIVATSAVVMGLQTLVSRETAPYQAAVVSIGTVQGGTANNVIPDQVCLTGTVRTIDPDVRKSMPGKLNRIVGGIAESYRCQGSVTYIQQVKEVYNHSDCAETVREVGASMIGADRCETPVPLMYGEDFAEYLEHSKGCFFWLGSGWQHEEGTGYGLHSSKFNLNEDCLPLGSALFAGIAVRRLCP